MATNSKVVQHSKKNNVPASACRNPTVTLPEMAGKSASSNSFAVLARPVVHAPPQDKPFSNSVKLSSAPTEQHLLPAAIPAEVLKRNDAESDESGEESDGEYCCSDSNCSCTYSTSEDDHEDEEILAAKGFEKAEILAGNGKEDERCKADSDSDRTTGYIGHNDAVNSDGDAETNVGAVPATDVAATSGAAVLAADASAELAANGDDSEKEEGKLDYVPVSMEDGKLLIAPCDDDISRCKKNWHECLVGYFVGSALPENVVKENARRMWGKKGLVDSFMTRRGFFFFRFDSELARKMILETGPHFMLKHHIVLQQYENKMRLIKERQKQIAIWVKFFDIPPELLSYRGLSLVASAVGKPLYLDEVTKKMLTSSVDRFNFARVCVMADAERPFPNEMYVDYGDGDEHIKIEAKYEWRPPHCSKCKVFGHSCDKRTNEKVASISYAEAAKEAVIQTNEE